MKVVILCGGKGTRMGEITSHIPKPMALVQGKPLLWHIMNIYSQHGFEDFILTLGYKGEKIKEYFVNYDWLNNDFVKDGNSGTIELLQEPMRWKITFINTGIETMTGGRLHRIKHLIEGDTFMLTYGDGLANVDIGKLLQFHREHKKIATVTGVYHKSSFGIIETKDAIATSFREKPQLNMLINGGFYVLNSQVFDYLDGKDDCIFEKTPLNKLTQDRELAVYTHRGFWMAVDTYKDLLTAEKTWNGSTPVQPRVTVRMANRKK
ncbi:MAG: sugar phosphate nucleotidyltransferase [Dethiobacteria bacterium]